MVCLREDQAVAFADLYAAGISYPAAVISELEVKGYVFEHVHQAIAVRLLHEPADPLDARWRRPRR